MIWFAYLTLVFTGLLNTFKVLMSVYCLRQIKSDLEQVKDIKYPHIYLMMPVLRESSVIRRTLDKFSQLSYPAHKLDIVVITTEKEAVHRSKGNILTKEVVGQVIQELSMEGGPSMRLIHFPHTRGIKSDQLNYALTCLKDEISLHPSAYVGVYDADSSIEPNTLKFIALDTTKNGHADAYQQPTSYLANSASLNMLGMSFALFQTVYALCHESYNYLHQSTLMYREVGFYRKRMRYLVGHGMFIRASMLFELGGFPSPIEDTRLGQRLSYLDREIRVIPTFDLVETAQPLVARIRQSSVWVTGLSLFVEDYKALLPFTPLPICRSVWLSLHRFWRNVVWVSRGIVVPLLCIWIGYHLGILWGLSSVLIYLYLPIIMFLSVSHWLDDYNLFPPNINRTGILRGLLLLPVEFVFASLGPIWGLAKVFVLRSKDENVLFPKTER